MATETTSPVVTGGQLKPTLGLTGVTINAMALIAPGAFLWTTFQAQSATGAIDMWPAVFVATAIALLTAICYAALAGRYPEAGAGSSYFYAEAAILAKEEHKHFRFARIAKFVVGWVSHLYYWVYPGVMVAFMGTLIVFIGQLFNPNFATAAWQQILICVIFACIVGAIAYIGVTGSTLANIVINVIQILALVTFTALAIAYRLSHPSLTYEHANGLSVVLPHDFNGLLFQSTIAILLVVGFESATALAGEAKNPKKDIPRGVVLSLIIQAVLFYFLEYFGANFFVGSQYTAIVDKSGTNFSLVAPTVKAITDPSVDQKVYAGGQVLHGLAAAASSGAPIGDFSKIIGDALLGGNGFAFELIIAITVVLALIGTALSCLATGVRVTYAMGKDKELPAVFGFLHGKFNTPHNGVITLTILSAAIGSFGVLNVDNFLIIALISNIGTFLLYGLTCILTYIAFAGILGSNPFSTKIAPILGAVLNFALMIGVFYYGIFGTGNAQKDTIIALSVSIGLLLIGFGYLFINSTVTKQSLLLAPNVKS